jgi:cytoskeletal protein CcmA (bactofilin family)
MSERTYENNFRELEEKLTSLYRHSEPNPVFVNHLESNLLAKAGELTSSGKAAERSYFGLGALFAGLKQRPALAASLIVVLLMIVTVSVIGPRQVLAQAQQWLGVAPKIEDCSSELGPITVDNLYVPPDNTCILDGTRVKGNVFVRNNASLFAYEVLVEGNLHADQAAQVEVHPGSYISGDLQVDYSGGLLVNFVNIGGNLQAFDNWGSQAYTGNMIEGDLQAFNNLAGLTISENSIGGNLQAFDNALGLMIVGNIIDGNLQANDNTGGVDISNNTVYGDLECEDNFPPPTGSGNQVSGDMEGQCAYLEEGELPPEETKTPTATTTLTEEMTPTITVTPTPTATSYIDPGGEDYTCTSSLGEVTVDDLYVPSNASCTLNGTYVMGNIEVDSNATLYAYEVRVDGNIQADQAARVEVHPSSYVGGNIQVDYSGVLIVNTVMVGGNLQAFDNWGSQSYSANTIGGDLQAFDNHGGVSIMDNRIDGNLQCKDNNPPPSGGGNWVGGNMEDQCANLNGGADTPVYSTPTPHLSPTPTVVQSPMATATSYIDPGGEDYTCTSSLGEVTVDDLYVPSNASCTLNGTYVMGNIEVDSNATLYAYGVRVDGNIQADRAAQVEVHPGSYIGGNLQVDYSGGLLVNSVNIDGNLQAFDNWGSQSYSANIIGGDLQAFDNSGGVSVLNNTIYGNLQCKENYPPPTGSGNIVHGDMEDQCAFMH